MGYCAQFRVTNPHQPDYSAAISRIYTRSLNQRHIPKRGQVIKRLLRSIFLNVSVLNTLNV